MRLDRTSWRTLRLLAVFCPTVALASFTRPSLQQAGLPIICGESVVLTCPTPTLPPDVRRFAQDAANRLVSIQEKTYPDSATWTNNTPTWDSNGNMLTDGSGLSLAYDSDNRVTNLQSTALGSRSFFYNGSGSVIKRLVNGTNVVDVLDGTRLLMSCATNGTALVYYIWGNGLVAQIGTNGVALFCHADGQGNVLAMTATNGAVTDQWFYSPYGQILNRTGSTDMPFQWLGAHGVRSEGGGIYRTRYRVYHAGVMRFMSADPIGLNGGANLYLYANGNPLLWVDMLGLCAENPASWFFRTSFQSMGQAAGMFLGYTGEALSLPQRGLDAVGLTVERQINLSATTPIPYDDAVVGAMGSLTALASTLRVEGTALGRLASAAQSVANASRLEKQLASEAQVGELLSGGGRSIAGAGASKAIDDLPRLLEEYGGRATEWAKVSSSSFRTTTGEIIETHAYRNIQTGATVELKTKL